MDSKRSPKSLSLREIPLKHGHVRRIAEAITQSGDARVRPVTRNYPAALHIVGGDRPDAGAEIQDRPAEIRLDHVGDPAQVIRRACGELIQTVVVSAVLRRRLERLTMRITGRWVGL